MSSLCLRAVEGYGRVESVELLPWVKTRQLMEQVYRSRVQVLWHDHINLSYVVSLIVDASRMQDVSILTLIDLFQLHKLRPVYRINCDLAAEDGFTESYVMF